MKEKLLELVFPVPSASVLCPGRPCLAGTRYQVGWPTFRGPSTHRALRRRSPPLAPSGPRWCQLPVFASSWIPGGFRSFPKPCLHFAHGPFFTLTCRLPPAWFAGPENQPLHTADLTCSSFLPFPLARVPLIFLSG